MPVGPGSRKPFKYKSVALDTETTGVDVYHAARPTRRGEATVC